MNKDLKKIKLKSEVFRQSLEGFRRWLKVQGYASSTVYGAPRMAAEYLLFAQSLQLVHLDQLSVKSIQESFYYLRHRPNQRRGGSVSASHYNKHIQSMKLYSQYLWHHHKTILPIKLKPLVANYHQPTVLTEEEVRMLYDVVWTNPILALRDRAMLDVFYGCGLRRNEGVQLCLQDIYLNKRIVFIKYGKQYKQRYVPITKLMRKNLSDYINQSRDYLLNGKQSDRLLISTRARPMDGQSMLIRIKALQDKVENQALRKKQIGLHTLRHSIATHLLNRGVPINQIARFLGHASVESTQLYTHLAHRLNNENDA